MKALPLLLLITTGPLVGAETLAELDAEIRSLEARLKDVQELVEKGCPGFVCSHDFAMIRGYKNKLQQARQAGDQKTSAELEEILKIYEQQLVNALIPKPLEIEGLAEDIERLKQQLANLRAKRDEMARKAEAPAAKPEDRIAELESKLAKLTEVIRHVCIDDMQILRKKLEQANKDIEQARKAQNQDVLAGLERQRDQMTKALAELALREGDVRIEDVPALISQLKGELTKLKMERVKREIEKRDQALNTIVQVIQNGLRCGNDAVDAERSMAEARKKLAAAKQAGDKDAAKSAEESIQKAAAFIEELQRPVIAGVTIETLTEDINRLKREKLELEAELDDLFWGSKPKQP